MSTQLKNAKTDIFQPLITEIKGHSLDDGNGIRSVIFFKGCPLACDWCHNPETISPRATLSYDKNECMTFGDCIDVCEQQALTPNNISFVNRDLCTLCGKCVETCTSEALTIIGKPMSVEDIIQKIIPYTPFYQSSGGGVTLSGGEATLYMDFCEALLKELKKRDIHVVLETSGYFNLQRFLQKLYPFVDQIYFDIKIMDNALHKKHCGQSNDRILENYTALKQLADNNNVPLLPRIPLIPGITATKSNLTSIASFLTAQGETQVSLLPYNPLWQEKAGKVGSFCNDNNSNNNGNNTINKSQSWLSKEDIERCHRYFSHMQIVN